jgi:hypothetical protein
MTAPDFRHSALCSLRSAFCLRRRLGGRLLSAICYLTISLGSAEVLVNDDTSGGTFNGSPEVSAMPDGRFLVVWEDSRRCEYDPDIYLQLFAADGQALDSNRVLSEDTLSRNPGDYVQTASAIATTRSGLSLVGWEDHRRGRSVIVQQLLDAQSRPVGGNRRTTSDTNLQTRPRVGACGSGFVVVWEMAAGSSGRTIYGARVDSLGMPGAKFRVADNSPNVWCEAPSIAGFRQGLVAAWCEVASERRVRIRWFDTTGTARGPSLGIGFSSAERPRLVCDSTGHGLLVWEEADGNPEQVWGQLFDTSGMVGPVFQLSDSVPCFRYHPAVTCDPAAQRFLVTWEDGRTGDTVRVFGQWLDRQGTGLGANFPVDSSPRANAQGGPVAVLLGPGSYATFWQDNRGRDVDVRGVVRIATSRYLRANSDVASSNQTWPLVVRDAAGVTTVFWNDNREDIYTTCIYGQRFDAELSPLGANFRVNDNPLGQSAQLGWAGGSPGGTVVAAWTDRRTGNDDVYAQLYSPDGAAVGPNFRVNDDAGTQPQYRPALAFSPDGDFVITWNDCRTGNWQPFAQSFDAAGRRLGHNWAVDSLGLDPSVGIAPDRSIWLSWTRTLDDSLRGPHPAIVARCFTADSQAVDTMLIVSDTAARRPGLSRLAVTGLGTVWITWNDSTREAWNAYARRIGSDRAAAGPNFAVDDEGGSYLHWLPAIADIGAERMLFSWTDFRTLGSIDVRARLYDTSGVAQGASIAVNTGSGTGADHWSLSPAAWGAGRTALVWQDNRRRQGWDVYCRNDLLPGISEAPAAPGRLAPYRIEVVPSIVRGACRIRLTGNVGCPAVLKIVDVSGRARAELVPDTRTSNSNGIRLDCQSWPAGVYYVTGTSLPGGPLPTQRFLVVR